jgi:hypothetical protein
LNVQAVFLCHYFFREAFGPVIGVLLITADILSGKDYRMKVCRLRFFFREADGLSSFGH